jgi:hypothetical protein
MTDSASPPCAPRWVIIIGIIAVVVAIAMGVLHLAGSTPDHSSHQPPAGQSTQP